MFKIFVYIIGLQKNARVAQQEAHYSQTVQNLLRLTCVRAKVIEVGNERQQGVPEPTLLTELLLQEVCVNLSAHARAAPGGF